MQAKSVHQNASKLLADANVAPRVAELQAKVSAIAEDRYAVTQERIIAEVARCAFYRADDFFEWGPSGVVVKDSTKLTPDQIAAVCEASQSITTGTIKIKLADKLAALDKLARIMGMFVEKVEHSGSLNISNMSDEELANIAAGRGAGTAASS
jgi:phage terminase small subunit